MAIEDALSGASEEIRAAVAMLGQGSQGASMYDQILAEFSSVPTSPLSRLAATSGVMAGLHETDPAKLRAEDFARTESPTGKILFRNGVIADPVNGQVYYPPTRGEANMVMGSEPWLFRIQNPKKGWDEKKANEWRKKLISWGYDLQGQLAPGGGMALDLIEALRQYHATTYLNYGKPIKMRPGGAAKQQIRKQVDMASLRATAASWYETAQIGPAGDAEQEWWADRIIDAAMDLVRGGLPVSSAVSKATNSQLEKFTETPEVEESIDVARSQETSTALRDKMFTIGQLASM